MEIFNFVVLATIASELATLRPRGELRLTSYSSPNPRHLWLHFLDATSHSRYKIELTGRHLFTQKRIRARILGLIFLCLTLILHFILAMTHGIASVTSKAAARKCEIDSRVVLNVQKFQQD